MKTERLANLVRELRGDMSQRQFAQRLGVSNVCVAHWEGQKGLPDPQNLKKLANYKGWSLDDIQAYLVSGKLPEEDNLQQILRKIQELPLKDVAHVAAFSTATLTQRLQAS